MSGTAITSKRLKEDRDLLGHPNDAYDDLDYAVVNTPPSITPCNTPMPNRLETPVPLLPLDLRGIARAARAMRATAVLQPPPLVFSQSDSSLCKPETKDTVESVEAEFSKDKFSWVYPTSSGTAWSPRIAYSRTNNHNLPLQCSRLAAVIVRDGVVRDNHELWPNLKTQLPDDKFAILRPKYEAQILHANKVIAEKITAKAIKGNIYKKRLKHG